MKLRREYPGTFRARCCVRNHRLQRFGIEAIASFGERLHNHVLVIPQRAANIGNALSEAVVGDEGIGPNRPHQRVFCDDLTRSRREHGTYFKRLAAKIDRLTFNRLQLFAFHQKDKTAKRDRFSIFRVDFRRFSGHFTLPARFLF